MSMRNLCSLVLVSVCCWATLSFADKKPAGDNVDHDYVRLTAEIRGTLEVGKDGLRVHVNQGGGCMTVYEDTWILDFGKDDALKASAAKLKGKAVVLTGEPERPLAAPHKVDLHQLGGVGANKLPEPPQLVVRVKSIAAAPAK